MNTITRTVHLYAKAPNYGTEIDYWVSTSAALDMKAFGRIVASTEAAFNAPDDMNVLAMAIEELEAEKADAAEKFRLTMARINDQLSKLQAISNEVPA